MLDTNNSNDLEYEEVIGVVEGRKNIGQGREQELKNEIVEKATAYYKKI